MATLFHDDSLLPPERPPTPPLSAATLANATIRRNLGRTWPRWQGTSEVRTDQPIVVRREAFRAEVHNGEVEPTFDPDAMTERFRKRAEAVRLRGLPPVEGPERQRIREQAQLDYMDYAMIGDCRANLVDGVLTLTLDLRPPEAGS